MQPAARVGDMHTCPMQTPGTPPIPHVGGPVASPGAPMVMIGFMPAATVGSMCTCVGPPDVIVKGSTKVLMNFMPAAIAQPRHRPARAERLAHRVNRVRRDQDPLGAPALGIAR